MDNENISFNNIEAECHYWKEHAAKCRAIYFNLQKEWKEHSENSEQARLGLFLELQQSEKQTKKFNNEIVNLTTECKNWKSSLEAKNKELSSLQVQLMNALKENGFYKNQLRELEQTNDDLKNEQRVLIESISNLDQKLDEAYEKIALLETEIDEKYNSKTEMSTQILMDVEQSFCLKGEENIETKKPKIIDMNTDKENQQRQSLKVKILNSFRRPKRGVRP